MASLVARLQSPRSFTAFFLLGLLVAAVVTVPLTAGGEGAAIGPLFVCTIQSVPEPEFPRVLFTVAIEPVPTFLVAASATRSSGAGSERSANRASPPRSGSGSSWPASCSSLQRCSVP